MPVTWIPGRGFVANAYLFGTVLIDAGVLPAAIHPFRNRIETIVLTHCHYDHTAHVKEIVHMCNAELAIHHLDAPGLLEDHLSLSLHFGARSPGITAQRLLSEGDVVGPLEVIHTPGHTAGSICLFSEEEQFLLSGDTVFTDGGFGRFDFPGGDRTALAQSIGKLASLPVEGLYPGHGTPVRHEGRLHISAALQLLKSGYV
ncbi:MAG TPA: MBL fold metallo-hydrolase [Methanoregulaceae archaeon]|jgi:glyoxylase-like metal-dependent hydrolase (beta-lactamase superfamily II)|nr:MBL fold metallo-hydrolase [Methanoregulaceae archaeon]MCC7469008.1 MBL fold metallo-hydrolase [Burkholderiaceae bacterium]NLH26178.1 MBL fold metallo-hydrolase [Methanomicrobiales archaeon]HNB03672.1 MBL fold metallo-hydrolase [Methanoregulaceae archaeon]HNI41518.1 MBL fold metallo-hydrolase [Methanoregulaceae archaeon]